MKYVKLFFLFFFFARLSFAQNKKNDSLAREIAREKIEGYRDRVIKGESMKKMAVLYSEDPGSAGKGGLYVDVKKGVMDPVFEKVAFGLKQGQVSQVFETAYGFHFIQLEKKHGKLIDLRHILIVPKPGNK